MSHDAPSAEDAPHWSHVTVALAGAMDENGAWVCPACHDRVPPQAPVREVPDPHDVLLEQVVATCDCWPEAALRAAPAHAVRARNHDEACPATRIISPAADQGDANG